MTSKLTRERLEKIKSWRETYGAGSNVMLPAEEAEELASIALAAMDGDPHTDDELSNLLWYSQEATCHSDPNYYCEFQRLATPGLIAGIIRELQGRRKAAMESEPVAEVLSNRPGNDTSTIDMALPVGTKLYRHAQQPVVEREPIAWLNDAYLARGVVDGEAGSEDAGPGYIPVYREAGPQPAPVVPEEVTAEDCPALVKYDVTEVDEAWARGFNSCRAAMLQAYPVCTCPSGDGSLRWPCPAHPGNSPAQSYCCPAQNSVSPAQNGIAPAQSPIDHGYRPECECSGCKATARICAELSVNSPANPDCWCRTCRPVVLNDMRFVVCPDCGNKRCPRANDHRNACTRSNEPGQEGSAYPAAPQEVRGE